MADLGEHSHAVLGENWPNDRLASPCGVDALLGNPGSATVEGSVIRRHYSLEELTIHKNDTQVIESVE